MLLGRVLHVDQGYTGQAEAGPELVRGAMRSAPTTSASERLPLGTGTAGRYGRGIWRPPHLGIFVVAGHRRRVLGSGKAVEEQVLPCIQATEQSQSRSHLQLIGAGDPQGLGAGEPARVSFCKHLISVHQPETRTLPGPQWYKH